MFIDNLDLKEQEKNKKEEQFLGLFNDPQKAEETFFELKLFFKDNTKKKSIGFRDTYWKWFAILLWDRFNFLSEEEIINIAFKRQFILGIGLDYDLDKIIKRYLASLLYEKEDVLELFLKIKNAVYSNEEEFIFEDTVYDFPYILKRFEEDNLMKDENLRKALSFNREKMLKLIDFLNLLKIEDKDVLIMLNKFLNRSPKVKNEAENNKVLTEPKLTAPSYAEIKAKILQFFPKDEQGEIIDTEGVFEVLEKTAAKYGDDKIKEMYYYNEETEKFEWSV